MNVHILTAWQAQKKKKADALTLFLFAGPPATSLSSLLFPFSDMTPCLGLRDKLSFYQSAVMPSRQTLSASHLPDFTLPPASPLSPLTFFPTLPAWCQHKASLPLSFLLGLYPAAFLLTSFLPFPLTFAEKYICSHMNICLWE